MPVRVVASVSTLVNCRVTPTFRGTGSLFCCGPSLWTSDRCGGRQLSDVWPMPAGLSRRHRTEHPAPQQPRQTRLSRCAEPLCLYSRQRSLHRRGQGGLFRRLHDLTDAEILLAMEQIFAAAHETVWWADKNGGVCCGRPLKLAGEVDAARKMMNFNKELFKNTVLRLWSPPVRSV